MSEPARALQPKGLLSGGGEQPPVGGGEKLPYIMTREEIWALLRSVDGPQALRDLAVLWTLYHSACRCSELVAANVGHFEADRRKLRLWRRKVQNWHVVDLHEQACHALRKYLLTRDRQPDAPLFLTRTGRRFDTSSVAKLVLKWGEISGVDRIVETRKNGHEVHLVHPHAFRGSKATHLIQKGASRYHVMALLGHRSSASTDKYVLLAQGALADVMQEAGL